MGEKIYKIRKLTPKECFRLMGVSDSDIARIQGAGISESQQYKLAGNSIVVDVMENIFDSLLFQEFMRGPINVVTTFSGYDSQCLALRKAKIPFNLVAWSEIDKYAIKAHDALFPEYSDRNLGDICQVDWSGIKDEIDLFTYSSPCQDFSNAGLRRGGLEGSGTRSSLLWEVKKAIMAKHPRILMMENVKNLVSTKFLPTFQKWLDWLGEQGYTNFWEVLNAKDYGIPQNRERVFVISLRDPGWFFFPQPFPLQRKLRDMLEDKVADKYYLPQDKVNKFIADIPEDRLKALENVDSDIVR